MLLYPPQSQKQKKMSWLEIYNSSQNPAFDNETKAVLQVLLNNHRIAPTSHQCITHFTNDGKISATAGDNQRCYEPLLGWCSKPSKKLVATKTDTKQTGKSTFKIKFDGTISNIKLVTLSDNEEYDKAALAAIVAMGKARSTARWSNRCGGHRVWFCL